MVCHGVFLLHVLVCVIMWSCCVWYVVGCYYFEFGWCLVVGCSDMMGMVIWCVACSFVVWCVLVCFGVV